MKKDKYIIFRVDTGQKLEVQKLLKKIAERDRFLYGEILVQALTLRNLMRNN